jgi:hypothetical protein
MEHPSGTTPCSTPRNNLAAAAGPGPSATVAERQARADWLITELGRLAAHAEDPGEQARIRRTADSLVRLAIAFRS